MPIKRDAQVAGALEVVAGQHAEAARVDRQALVQPELGREVGDRPRPQDRGVDRAPRVGVLEVLGQPAERVVDPRVEGHLGGPPLELLGRQPLEELDRIVVDLPPERRVELAEQRDDVRLPGPPEVPGQLTELVDQLRLTNHGRTPLARSVREATALATALTAASPASGSRRGPALSPHKSSIVSPMTGGTPRPSSPQIDARRRCQARWSADCACVIADRARRHDWLRICIRMSEHE